MHENDFREEGHVFQLDVSNIDKLPSVMTIESERNVDMKLKYGYKKKLKKK